MPEPSEQNARFQFSLRAVLLTLVMVVSAIALAGSLGFFLAYAIIYISSLILDRRFIIPPLVEILVLLALTGIYQAMFVPAIATFSEDEKQATCQHSLAKIAQAVNAYHDTFAQFPPASVPDDKGRPAHSWRVLILPFLGYDDLYSKYDFAEPWDGPNNKQLLTEIPKEYLCYSCYELGPTCTNRMALIGNDTVFRANRSLQRDEINDGAADTIMLIETDGKGVHWMDPVDFPVEDGVLPLSGNPSDSSFATNSLVLGPIHNGYFHIVMANSTAECLRADTPQSAFGALSTANGGESVELKRLTWTEPLDWVTPVSLVIFLVSSITMFCGAGMAYRRQARAQTQSDGP